MYEMNGKQYLLVSATQGAGRGGGEPRRQQRALRARYVAFALP